MQVPVQGWLEAFEAHPDLGSKLQTQSSTDEQAAFMKHSTTEQSGIQGADEEIKQQLVVLNERYRQRFGHVFLLCAQGKSASETLHIVRKRCASVASA